MDDIDVVTSGLAASKSGQPKKLAEYHSDALLFAGTVLKPIGKQEFAGRMPVLSATLPDTKFNARDFRRPGDKLSLVVQKSGTQTGELNLPTPGFQQFHVIGRSAARPSKG